MPLTPLVREFLVRVEDLLDAREWANLDRSQLETTTVDGVARLVLAHLDAGGLPIEIQIFDREVVVTWYPEHRSVKDRDEALMLIEALGDGRVELVVTRQVWMMTMRSYLDGAALPFLTTRMPWLTLRPRTARLHFGFT
ncbi:MAG: hypothetical protein ACT4OX_11525 [Actinomycetota bacterium]